jgi:hypothetical protein
MKVTRRSYYISNPHPAVDIADAVISACDETGGDEGVAERAHSRLDATAQIVGDLVAVLHRNGTLTDDDLLRHILTGYEEAAR